MVHSRTLTTQNYSRDGIRMSFREEMRKSVQELREENGDTSHVTNEIVDVLCFLSMFTGMIIGGDQSAVEFQDPAKTLTVAASFIMSGEYLQILSDVEELKKASVMVGDSGE